MDSIHKFQLRHRAVWPRLKRKCSKHKLHILVFLVVLGLFLPLTELTKSALRMLVKCDCPVAVAGDEKFVDWTEVNYLEFQVLKDAPLRRLSVIDGDQFPPKADSERIFFHESTGSDCLTSQQACAVEAAAHSNPERLVQVYMMTSELNETCPAFRSLSFYDNVEIVLIDGDAYFEQSPLGQWYFSRQWEDSEDPSGHVGHMLRLLSLWKAGGLSLNFDQWIVSDLNEPLWSEMDFIVQDISNRPLIDQVASFERKHPLVESLMRVANATYRKKNWDHERSAAYRHLVVGYCRKARKLDDDGECPGLSVLEPGQFYPSLTTSSGDYIDPEEETYKVAALDGSTLRKNETLREALAPDLCPHSFRIDKRQ